MYVNVKCPNIYIKNKTFIIRSYISVSSKPSKTQYIYIMYILYIYIYIYYIYRYSIKLYTHAIRAKKLNKKQLKIQWTQHLSKSPV